MVMLLLAEKSDKRFPLELHTPSPYLLSICLFGILTIEDISCL